MVAKRNTDKTPTIEAVNIGAVAFEIGSREHMAAVSLGPLNAPEN